MASKHQTASSSETAADDTSGHRAAATMLQAPLDIPPRHPLRLTPESSSPRRCVAYMDLTREECGRLFPSGRLRSQPLRLAGQPFFLTARCNMDQRNTFHCFGLFLAMEDEEEEEEGSPASVTVEYDFAARTWSSGDAYVSKYKGYYTFTCGRSCGYRNLLGTPWTSFMGDGDDGDSVFFIDGVLHLRAELSVKEEA